MSVIRKQKLLHSDQRERKNQRNVQLVLIKPVELCLYADGVTILRIVVRSWCSRKCFSLSTLTVCPVSLCTRRCLEYASVNWNTNCDYLNLLRSFLFQMANEFVLLDREVDIIKAFVLNSTFNLKTRSFLIVSFMDLANYPVALRNTYRSQIYKWVTQVHACLLYTSRCV